MTTTDTDFAIQTPAADKPEVDKPLRVLGFYLPESELIGMLGRWRETSVVVVRDYSDIPADAKVRSVNYCWERRAFFVVCEHESFPIHHPACFVMAHPQPIRATRAVELPIGDGSCGCGTPSTHT